MRRLELLIAVAVVAALVVVTAAEGAPSKQGGSSTLLDRRADSPKLKRRPELDIRRVTVAPESGNRVKFKISMQGKLKPGKKFTRPFVLVNTRGGSSSKFEYLALGPRLFKRVGDKYRKVGANNFTAKRKTWVYRFKPARIGVRAGESFGWAVLTSKGGTSDLAPNRRYETYRVPSG